MPRHNRPSRIALPTLSDQAAVDILEFLYAAIECFESSYYVQLRRYHDERSRYNRRRPEPPLGDDDVPF